MRQIAANAGVEPSVVVGLILITDCMVARLPETQQQSPAAPEGASY